MYLEFINLYVQHKVTLIGILACMKVIRVIQHVSFYSCHYISVRAIRFGDELKYVLVKNNVSLKKKKKTNNL